MNKNTEEGVIFFLSLPYLFNRPSNPPPPPPYPSNPNPTMSKGYSCNRVGRQGVTHHHPLLHLSTPFEDVNPLGSLNRRRDTAVTYITSSFVVRFIWAYLLVTKGDGPTKPVFGSTNGLIVVGFKTAASLWWLLFS
jgi:hypothetical protein